VHLEGEVGSFIDSANRRTDEFLVLQAVKIQRLNSLLCALVCFAGRDRPQAARAKDPWPSAALSSRRDWSEQFSGSDQIGASNSNDAGSVRLQLWPAAAVSSSLPSLSSFPLPRVPLCGSQPSSCSHRDRQQCRNDRPKHVHYWTLRGSAQFRRSLNYLVDVLDVYIKSSWRGADALRTSPSHRHILWTKHQSCAAQCQFCVHRLTIGAVHYAALSEPKCFLVKADRAAGISGRGGLLGNLNLGSPEHSVEGSRLKHSTAERASETQSANRSRWNRARSRKASRPTRLATGG